MDTALERRRGIGQNIRDARKRARLTLQALAATVNTDAPSLSRIEKGQRGLDSVLLCDLAEQLHVAVGDLLAEQGSATFARGAEQPGADDAHVRWAIEMIEDLQAAERMVKRYGL